MSNLRMPVLQVGLFEGAATSPDLSLEAINAEGLTVLGHVIMVRS
jgi:hypothetical protein